MRQTLAILLDSYRELNARKLFWITLILSGLIVVSFSLVGINEDGPTFLWWQLPEALFPGLTTDVMSRETFYKTIFSTLGISFWLAWIATILALVTTAGMIPEFLESGTVELVLSKPIGRARLFLTKYVGGLLFVALQVTVFTVASMIVLGIRGGAWVPGLLMAVPLVVIFFSYLFSICVLLGLLTRSAIASLLLTLLIWLGLFSIHATETSLMVFRIIQDQRVESLQRSITRAEGTLERYEAGEGEVAEAGAVATRRRLETWNQELADARDTVAGAVRYHRAAMTVKTILPKTSETIGLLERSLIDLADLPVPPSSGSEIGPGGRFVPDSGRLQMAAIEEVRGRSTFWILGTSLGFEAALLAIGAFIFVRRDF